MRPISNFTLHAMLAAVITAIAATSAAAAPTDAFMKLGTVRGEIRAKDPHDGHIEIESWSWSTTDSSADLGSWAKADGLEVSQSANSDMVMKGQKIGQNAPASRKYVPGKAKYSNVRLTRSGNSAAPGGNNEMRMEDSAGKERSSQPRDDAPGLATGKRVHKPFALAKPLDKGSVWVRVSSPWTDCRVGARYPLIELGRGAERYVLHDAAVSRCSSAAGGGALEEVSFTYQKIELRK